jgi:hypothetical protein
MSVRLARLVVVVTLGVLGASCPGAGCRPKVPPVAPLERLPATTTAALFGPALGQATAAFKVVATRLEGRAATAGTPPKAAVELAARLGFDPFTDEGLRAAGLEPGAPFAVGWEGPQAGLLVLPVTDGTRALETVARVAKLAHQADRVSQERVGEVTVTTYARPFGSREVVALGAAVVGSHVLLCQGKDAGARLAGALAVTPVTSLDRHPDLAPGRRPGGTAPLHFLVNASWGAQAPDQAQLARATLKDLLGTVDVTGHGLTAVLHARLHDARRADTLATLFPPGPPLPALALASDDVLVLGKGRFLAQRGRALAASADPSSQGTLDRWGQEAQRLGVDVDQALLDLTDGHYAAALYATPTEEARGWLTGTGAGRRDVLRLAPYVALMRATPGTPPAALLDRLLAKLRARGVPVEVSAGPTTTYTGRVPGSPPWRVMRLAVVDNVLVVGGGPGDWFSQVVARLVNAPAAPPPGWPADVVEPLRGGSASVIVGRVHAGVAALDGLLAADLGSDADALVLRSLLGKVRAALASTREVSLVLEPEGDGVRARLSVRWTPEGP